MNPENNRKFYPSSVHSSDSSMSHNVWPQDQQYMDSAMSEVSYARYQPNDMDGLSEFSLPSRTGTEITCDWNRSLPPGNMAYEYERVPAAGSEGCVVGPHMISDVENGKRQLPECIHALSSDDSRIVLQGTRIARSIAMLVPLRVLVNSCFLQCVVRVLGKFEAVEVLHDALSTLQHLSMSSSEGCIVIHQFGGVPAVLHILGLNSEVLVNYGIIILHNIILGCDQSLPLLRMHTHVFVALLHKSNVKFLAITIDCLQLICHGSAEAKRAVFNCNGHEELVSLLFSNTYEKLLWSIARLVKVLSVDRANKSQLIRAGIVQALSKHLEGTSDRFLVNALGSLRNLSDEALKMPGMYHLVGHLVRLLGHSERQIVVPSLCALMNLTCTNHDNKQTLIREGGIPAVLMCLEKSSDVEAVVEPALGILRLMASRNPHAQYLRSILVRSRGIELIRRAFDLTDNNYAILKHLMYLTRSLAHSNTCSESMRVYGFVHCVLAAMNKAFSSLSQGITVIPEENVNLEVLLENSLGTLQSMARDPASRAVIVKSNCLHVFVQILLSGPTDDMSYVTCGLLFELSVDRSVIEYLRQFELVSVLSSMIDGKEDPIYTYINTILKRLSSIY